MHNIENEFIKHFDSSAPDLLKKIQDTPVVLISSEDELFSEINRETKKDSKPLKIDFKWCSIAATIAAIFVCAIIFFPKNLSAPQIAGNIIIDCNPSINIEVTEELKVHSFYAVNDDGVEILEKIDTSNTIEDIVEQVVCHLKNDGYLYNDNNNILVSYCYKNNAKKFGHIKNLIEKNLVDDDIGIIYQSFKEDNTITKKAERKNVSIGKYVYIKKVNRDNNINENKLYNMNINHIAENVEKDNPESTVETNLSSKNKSENEITVTKPTVTTEPTDNTQININKNTNTSETNKGKNQFHQNENATAKQNGDNHSTKATESTTKSSVGNTNKDKPNSGKNSDNANANSNKNEKPPIPPQNNKDKQENKNTAPSNQKATNANKNNSKSESHKNTNKSVKENKPIDVVH